MIGYVGLVQEGMLGEIKPEQNEALKKSLQYSKNLLNMISDILHATRLEARDATVETSNVRFGNDFPRPQNIL
jgi:signal transduction histidine kinase